MATTRISAAGSNCAGFSLPETLIILVILTLLLSLVVGAPPQHRARPLAQAIAVDFRTARETAIRSGAKTQVIVNLSSRTWRSPKGRESGFPDWAGVTILSAEELAVHSDKAVFEFYPDGTASGGMLHIAAPSNCAEVKIDWLTSEVSTYDSCKRNAIE